jgi:hypothetical protein
MTIFDFVKPTMKIPCPRCKKETMTMGEWPGPCSECKKDPKYLEEQKKKQELNTQKGPNTYTGKKVTDDITHFVKDESGQSFGVDVKGKLHRADDTRYDIKNDKNGWKETGVVKK